MLLIDTRERPPEPAPERSWRIDWRPSRALVAAVVLFLGGVVVPGWAGVVLMVSAMLASFRALERGLGNWEGLGEHRQ
jgi:hypothetical protein